MYLKVTAQLSFISASLKTRYINDKSISTHQKITVDHPPSHCKFHWTLQIDESEKEKK